MEAEIQHLMQETRLWRIANSAQWVAWGIVQAKVEDMDDLLESQESNNADINDPEQLNVALESDPLNPEVVEMVKDAHDRRPEGDDIGAKAKEGKEEEEGEEEEFDYLAYAQERALFFWGDVLQLGLVKKEDLPADLLQKIKVVQY